MRRLMTPLKLALVAAGSWLILGSAILGALGHGDVRAGAGWLLLALIALATLTAPARLFGYGVAALASLGYAATLVLHTTISGRPVTATSPSWTLIAGVILVFCFTPAVLSRLLHEIERLSRQVQYQASVIDDLTIRDPAGPPMKPKYVEAIIAEEIDRARRYHRSLTLAIVAADDWDELATDLGEVGARNLAARIVDQLAQGTRTVDKIVQMGGGTFALVLPETPLEGAEVLASRLQAASSAETGVTLRIGLADYPRDAHSSEALLKEAREALIFAGSADLLVVDRTLLG